MSNSVENRVVIVGGCGHVGLPLAVALSASGSAIISYDVNLSAVNLVNSGVAPFFENGLDQLLNHELSAKRFSATTDMGVIGNADIIIVVIGTPVDEHLNPDPASIRKVLEEIQPFLKDGQLLILRSTIYPGVTQMVESFLSATGNQIDVAFCPERIAEGYALDELRSLPQIIGARTAESRARAEKLFTQLAPSIIHVSPEEAELAKLFTNTWRYLKFAAANQLYMIANDAGVDFERVRMAVTTGYPRASDMPGAGFAAGPCLLKDTMQLAAFNNNQFTLGHASMMVNEGLPLYLVSQVEKRYELKKLTVGILGMAFKGDNDDTRSSLSYKLKHVLDFRCKKVICADENVRGDDSLIPESQLISDADVIFIGAAHKRYRSIGISEEMVFSFEPKSVSDHSGFQ
jgi:UDP-N-acetyl-D-mannosaminuronic acid dehydrogenase